MSKSDLSVSVGEHQAGLCQGVQVRGLHARGAELVRGLQHADVGPVIYLSSRASMLRISPEIICDDQQDIFVLLAIS